MPRIALLALCVGVACSSECSWAAFDGELHAAIQRDDVDVVRVKLSTGVDLEPDCRPNLNCKPLVYAATLDRRRIVEMLVDAGADLNSTSPVGDTALIRSIIIVERKLGDAEMAKYLVRKGADVNKPNMFGVSPFLGACTAGDLELIALMLAHGAKVDSAFPNQISPDSPERDTRNTCLHRAVMAGRLEAARLVLGAGANPKVKNSMGKTPADYAEQAGRKDLVDLLSNQRE